MEIVPEGFLQIIQKEKSLQKSILDIETKIESIISEQRPIFFPHYTNHGIKHFTDTLRMAYQIIDLDEVEKLRGQKAVIDYLSPLNAFVLSASVLFHDLGMHIHFKGFKQLINGYNDDVRVSFFDDNTWEREWDNFMIEAKRFSGRDRINIFGDDQTVITDIDFSKDYLDSETHKLLIGEFLRRHHGRLAHEIAIKGFPIQNNDSVSFAEDLSSHFKDIIGLIARSHTMNVRDAMDYIAEQFPADPHFPYQIEIPLLMCILRIADYFQFDNTRTNAFLIKLASIRSPFSLEEHKTHLATEYFKTDENDPETLFIDVKPNDGKMFIKLSRLFVDMQNELDTCFAIIGEMYGRNKAHLKLRYRRIKTSLKNRKVIERLPYVPNVFRFEADIDLFKLLVGPLYGYNPNFGVRELLQNSVDACNELSYKIANSYQPVVDIRIDEAEEQKTFTITDNGKGMSIGEIKNYFLKAGASFRHSMEWKKTYETDEHISQIRRSGKFGIGVLAAFLIGPSIEVTTKRYNETLGYKFTADLTNEFIEVDKMNNCPTGTKIVIRISSTTYTEFTNNLDELIKWFIYTTPRVTFWINKKQVSKKPFPLLDIENNKQRRSGAIRLPIPGFHDVIWQYLLPKDRYDRYDNKNRVLAVNGIIIPQKSYWQDHSSNAIEKDKLQNYPFVSIIDQDNKIDFELNRNSIRGDLPFVRDLIVSCQLEFLFELIFHKFSVEENKHFLHGYFRSNRYSPLFQLHFRKPQYPTFELVATDQGYIPHTSFFSPVLSLFDKFKIFKSTVDAIHFTPNSVCYLQLSDSKKFKQEIVRGGNSPYVAVSKSEIFNRNIKNPAIKAEVRDNITVISKEKDYTIYKFGDISKFDLQKLKNLFEINNADAIHQILKYSPRMELVDHLFKEHLINPSLIPFDLKEKMKYIKTLSPEFQQYVANRQAIE